MCIWNHSNIFPGNGFFVLRESDGKYSLFDEIWQTRHFWEQTGPANEKGSEIIRTCRLHQSPPIPGTVALVDITEQTRVYHYKMTQSDLDWPRTAKEIV